MAAALMATLLKTAAPRSIAAVAAVAKAVAAVAKAVAAAAKAVAAILLM